jgi:DNA-binding response OmpR family regulator
MSSNGDVRPAGHDTPPGADHREPTVLLIEDDDNVRFAMAALLAHEGYQILTAASAHDALGVLRMPHSPIDVVVLDVHLPDASGIDVCARLRELHPQTSVIVCTGAASPAEGAELLRLGAHRYLQKPISPDELLATVEASLP